MTPKGTTNTRGVKFQLPEATKKTEIAFWGFSVHYGLVPVLHILDFLGSKNVSSGQVRSLQTFHLKKYVGLEKESEIDLT